MGVEFRKELPKTMVGKVLRRMLAAESIDRRSDLNSNVDQRLANAGSKLRGTRVSPCTQIVSTSSGTRVPSAATTIRSRAMVTARFDHVRIGRRPHHARFAVPTSRLGDTPDRQTPR